MKKGADRKKKNKEEKPKEDKPKRAYKKKEEVKIEPLKDGEIPKLFSSVAAQSRILPHFQETDSKTNQFLREVHERLTWLMMGKFVERATDILEARQDQEKKPVYLDPQTMGEFLGGFEIPMEASSYTEEEVLGFKDKTFDLVKMKSRLQKVIGLGEEGQLSTKRAVLLEHLLERSQP